VALPLRPGAVLGLLRDLRSGPGETGPLCVTGAPALAGALLRELARGAAPGAVREGYTREAAALVHVLAAPPDGEDRRLLADAEKARIPVAVMLAGPELDPRIPYVLATDVVVAGPGRGFPVDELARVVARRLGERGVGVAARVPVVRGAVCDELIARASRRNGVLGAAIFIPGADFPVLTMNQLRLVLRIGLAHGVTIDNQRVPEVLGVIGSGLAFRTLARQALGVIPLAGWAVKGGVAYGGTRALGEAAVKYFELRTSEGAAA
jgi:uncharacterized protein (DUF697 family)